MRSTSSKSVTACIRWLPNLSQILCLEAAQDTSLEFPQTPELLDFSSSTLDLGSALEKMNGFKILRERLRLTPRFESEVRKNFQAQEQTGENFR